MIAFSWLHSVAQAAELAKAHQRAEEEKAAALKAAHALSEELKSAEILVATSAQASGARDEEQACARQAECTVD